jgi:propanol-preferring alcohol dehydrogenase
MKAAILHEFKQPLTIEEVKLPETSNDEVLIEVEVCGVCHSDLHVAEGDWTQLSAIIKKPLILGHEIVGRVIARGTAVQNVQVGDRVGVPWINWTCGQCEFCREGNENLCIKQRITGVTVDGGYAEFVKAPASHTIPIPAELSSEQAAPLLCAGVTVHRALKQVRLRAGQRVGVFGVGGLGHLAVQIARAAEADITAIDVSEGKLVLAHALGATRTLNATEADVVKEVRRAGGLHVALVTSAAMNAYDTAFSCVRPGGTLLVVGLPGKAISLPPIVMAAREIQIKASAVGTREDIREILAMGAAGTIRCQVTTRPLEQVREVLGELNRGQISGRVGLRLRKSHGS